MMTPPMKTFKFFIIFLTAVLITSSLNGCDRTDTAEIFDTVNTSTPNKFLQYPNLQASLAAGTYTVVAATANAASSGSFTLSITTDDGTTIDQQGNWLSSGGKNALSNDNPKFTFTLNTAGGVNISLLSEVDNYLYLLDRSNNILFEDDNSGPSSSALIDLPASRINNKKWSEAYYAAIDPNNERSDLEKWKTKNGFDAGADVHIIFRDTLDLGYGRSLFMRKNQNGCLAFYVENFFVNVIDGLPYSTLNLTAAIQNEHIYHFGVNAIEFSDLDGDCDGSEPMFNKFYTFDVRTGDHLKAQARLSKIDLDNRGEKFMPLPCITCHGGAAKPLLADGSFASSALPGQANPELRIGDTNAKLQPLVVDVYEYSDTSGFTHAEQETKFKEINNVAFSTYLASRADGEWDADFMREVVDGWYGGNFISSSNNKDFNNKFVPQGWKYNPADSSIPASRPASSEELFLNVVKPFCFSCHSKRGSTMGSDNNNSNASGLSKDINFSSYEKFTSYINQIENYVFARGQMPMSRLNFDKFWESNAPEILASHIPNFKYANADGSIDIPGKPIAHAGLDRTVVSPVTLSAEASVFASNYSWKITNQPSGSLANINNANALRTSFTADTNGTYTLELSSSNNAGESSTDTVTLTIDNSLSPTQTEITFDDHISPILTGNCSSCHGSANSFPGIPLFYDISSIGYTVYENVKQRINFSNVEYSQILQKPSGSHHYGGTVFATNSTEYNMLLNWILEGAREK